ncbi:MAG TPA: protein-L-isoaspartate(D-aspartate) O-methyltransferase [Geobacteraceae bacterium]|nr:protein-L-isoaspartate(D-aspartate) O-methyltransferase [Geobacteraceae bacterium]
MNFDIARKKMVETQIVAKGVKDRRVIDAMLKVPRHLFVQEAMAGQAYSDTSLPIGEKQTISQPYMVALMSELLDLKGGERVLEIGTGSGYQAAVLSHLARRVYTIERIPSLASRARKLFDTLSLTNISMKIDDGTVGWESEAKFDAIIVTAGAPEVPYALVEQLVAGGCLVIPVGDQHEQVLYRLRKMEDGTVVQEKSIPCRFVKLIGRNGWTAEQ